MVRQFNLFFFSFLIWNSLFSQNFSDQNYSKKTYTVDQGLPNNHVRSIAQDQNGFIWIAMWDAVSRYDGNEFKNYYHDPQDSLSVPGMDIQNMIIDRHQNIWLINPFGIYRFNREKDNFLPDLKFKNSAIYDIACDTSGNSCFYSDQGLFRFNYNSGNYEILKIDTALYSIPGNSRGDLSIDINNNWWIHTGNKVIVLSPELKYQQFNLRYTYRIDSSVAVQSPNLKYNFQVSALQEVKILSSSLGLFRANKNSYYFERTGSPLIENMKIPNLIWWNESIKEFYVKKEELFFRYTKDGSTVESCFVDANNIIWLGEINDYSEGLGLTKISLNNKKFKHFLSPDELGGSEAVISLLKDLSGRIWVGTIGNNFLYKIENGKAIEKCIFIDQEYLKHFTHIRSLLIHNDNIYAGNFNEPLFRFDLTDLKPEYLYPGKLNKVIPDGFNTFKILINDHFNNLVVVGSDGFCVFSPDLGKVLFYDHLWDGGYFSLIQDNELNYWIGGKGILVSFDKKFQNRTVFTIAEKKYNIESIIEGDTDYLWLALLGGGICKFNKINGKYEIYSTQHGLKNSTCYNILKDKHGHIWVSSNQGISMFNPETKRFRNFGEAEGLRIVEFNADAVWHGDDDEMMFGGMGGFVSFYPDSIENMTQDYFAPLQITELKVSGISYFPNIYELRNVELEKGMDNFQLGFACLDYLNADKLLYRYRLMENDTGWIVTDNRKRFANYINLKPGKYHFRVQVTNPSGDWQEKKEASLAIIIPAFYYQTFLFKATTGITGILLVLFSLLMYIRQLKLKEQRKHELILHEEEVKREQLKLEALRGQLNPHFIFNSLNSVNDFILDNDAIKANQYLTDFSNLMRAFLESSKREYIPLIKEIELLEHYLKLEQIRYADRFDFVIDYDEVQNLYAEISPSIVQPFVENAVWHGIGKMGNEYRGIIRLIFTQEHHDCVICIVEDNGIGISKANALKSDQQKKRQSRGISIIQERLDIINSTHNKNYSINMEEANPGSEYPGTRVTIEIPVKV